MKGPLREGAVSEADWGERYSTFSEESYLSLSRLRHQLPHQREPFAAHNLKVPALWHIPYRGFRSSGGCAII